jgi:hypothetical protein
MSQVHQFVRDCIKSGNSSISVEELYRKYEIWLIYNDKSLDIDFAGFCSLFHQAILEFSYESNGVGTSRIYFNTLFIRDRIF